jgi:MFS superfamily sulfate permease-like transporter
MFFESWKKDFQSSLVVFLVALPLCLGIALASNVPLSAGIFAGIIGGIVVGAISGSSLSVSGPAAGLTVIIASTLQVTGSFEALALAIFLSGIFQIIFGLIRVGAIGDYFPSSVIKGMLAAIGIILILKQFPHAVGFDADFMGDESYFEDSGRNTFSQLIYALNLFHPGAVVISLISAFIMLFWEKLAKTGNKIFQFIPGALIAVIISVLLNNFFLKNTSSMGLSGTHLVSLPFQSGVSDFFGRMNFPDWSYVFETEIYIAAFTIAIVGSLESLLSIDATDKMDSKGRITNKNRELLAQGFGNAISGLVGGLPVTAVIVRTSANINAGAVSKLSAIFHGLWLALCVILIPHILNLIPLAVLASILILVGFKLTKPEIIKKMYSKGMNQFIPFIVTVLAILFTNLLLGILIGIAVGFIFVLRSNIHKSIVMVHDEDHFLVRFYKDVSFLQKPELQKILSSIPSKSYVVIDGSDAVFVDEDIVDAIEDFIKRGESFGIKVSLKTSPLALCPLFKEL